jgi:hypothetical protein
MKRSSCDILLMAAIIPVIIQAGIMVGITFYGFGLALLTSLNVI